MSLATTLVTSAAGALVWRHRLRHLRPVRAAPPPPAPFPRVSIVVPARDEAHNLPVLLPSLAALDPPAAEVIVVDDHSSDGTAAVARAHGARVVAPPPLPPGWTGKPWACLHGAREATGELLLFTDADTAHAPGSLGQAVALLEAAGADLLSFIATHRIEFGWERLQGPLHLILLLAGRAGAPGGDAVYANGQYLLFHRHAYLRAGGHAAVGDAIAEDLALAGKVREAGGRVILELVPGALRARMYPEGPGSLVAGWRRSFRDGMRSSGPRGFLEVLLAVAWLLGLPIDLARALLAGAAVPAAILGVAWAATVVEVGRRQRLVGDFPAWSAPLYPLFVVVFVLVSVLAAVDSLLGRPARWKGRRIDVSGRPVGGFATRPP